VEVIPMTEPKAPPTPPLPTVYLDTLKPKVLKNGPKRTQTNKSVQGTPLTIAGKQYERGLGVQAVAEDVCPVPAGATRFVSVVGLDDEALNEKRASVTFEVYGDVKEMGEAPVRIGQSPVLSAATIRFWSFDIALNSRFKELLLVVTDGGDGNAGDYANWANAGFIVPAAK
jgi:hypothetical protein